jgi:hypothetical protein
MIKNGIALLVLVMLGGAAHADGDYISPTNDRLRLSFGVMKASAATTLRVDSSAGKPGTEISGEDDLGLDSSRIVPKFQALVRVSDRHRLRFDYFMLDRSDSHTLTAPIAFRDVTLQTGDPVQSDLSLRTLGITYGYSFLHRENFELAATLGVNMTDISARARVQSPTRHIDQSENQAGPFPTLGLDGTWVLSKRFYFDGRWQYLQVHVNNLSGSLSFYELDALYRLRPNISFALGYNGVNAKLTSTQSTQAGFFNFKATGPEFFVRIAF